MQTIPIVNKKARIELIPLIDVVFLLLVFFIYTMLAMTVHRGIMVDLSAAKTSLINTDDYLTVTVTADNQYFVDRRSVSPSELLTLLKNERGNNPALKIFLNTDKFTFHWQVITVLDLIKTANIQQVFFETTLSPQ